MEESISNNVNSSSQNIKNRRAADHALIASEKKFRTLFESMQEGFALHEIICDDAGKPVDYRYLDINPAFERLTGLTREATVGRTVREIVPDIGEYWIQLYGHVAMTGEPAEMERHVEHQNRYYRAKAFSPELGTFVVIFEDITEQRQALIELKRSEEQLRVVFETSRAGILMVNPVGFITLANNRMAEMLGYSIEELLQTRYPDHIHPDQRDLGDDRMRKLIAGEIDHVATERRFIRKDGSEFWGYMSGRRHEDEQGKLISLVGHITDITERIRAEEQTRAQLVFQENLIETIPLPLFYKDSAGVYAGCNSAFCHFMRLSKENIVGHTVYDIAPPELASIYHEADLTLMRKSGKQVYEARVKNADGALLDVIFYKATYSNPDGSPAGMIGAINDITERKRAEEERLMFEQQLLHAQKLESLGVLAGGIAHDFNNILTAIIGNADLALMRINKESPAVDNLHRIEQAASRAADLAKQMLAYSGKGKFMVECLDLNLLLEEMLHMLEVSISKKAVLRFNLTRPLPGVEADATQMRQIIMNLVINASEAIGDRSGVIAVTTGCMDCDDSYLKGVWLDENLKEGLYVYLEIADTGCGMDKDTLAKLFDPFFTTKFTGRGLGMAAVLGIVRGHHGAIKVYSEHGKGSSFKIMFPTCDRPVEIFNGDSSKDDWLGSGTVLLVDDEETVRGIGSELLKELGFSTITANDGREALEIYKSRNDIAFVIMDLTMPHMDGEQCFRELRRINPAVKVIMSSGYNEQEVTEKFVGKGLSGFIQKPYRLSVLKEAVKRV